MVDVGVVTGGVGDVVGCGGAAVEEGGDAPVEGFFGRLDVVAEAGRIAASVVGELDDLGTRASLGGDVDVGADVVEGGRGLAG